MKTNIIKRILAKLGIYQHFAQAQRQKIGNGATLSQLSEFEWEKSTRDPNAFYNTCVAYFDQHLASNLKEHRNYFCQEQRGFGEDAFHVMWSLLVERFKPETFLEIGVYRGQVLSLISLLQKELGIRSDNTGIGPFERMGDQASVVAYGHCSDWLEDIKTNIAYFKLPTPNLVKAFSTDPEAIEVIKSTAWDMIYIDGNHDYEVVVEDWKYCSANIKVGGVIVLDDSGLNSGYEPSMFSTAGFPGPSRIANSIDKNQFKEILQVGHNRAFQRIC